MKIYVICYMCFASMLTLTYSIKLSQEINPCQEPKKRRIDQFFSQKLVWKILLLIKISYLHMHQDSRISTVKTFLSKFCELGPNFRFIFHRIFRDTPHHNHSRSIWRVILRIYSI